MKFFFSQRKDKTWIEEGKSPECDCKLGVWCTVDVATCPSMAPWFLFVSDFDEMGFWFVIVISNARWQWKLRYFWWVLSKRRQAYGLYSFNISHAVVQNIVPTSTKNYSGHDRSNKPKEIFFSLTAALRAIRNAQGGVLDSGLALVNRWRSWWWWLCR